MAWAGAMGFASIDEALEKEIGEIKEDDHLGLSDARLEKYVRIVASKDMFRRFDGAKRASWLSSSATLSI